MLGPQPAVGGVAFDFERRRLDARFLAHHQIDQLDGERRALGPAQVHALQHVGPVLRLGAARAGLDLNDRVALVIRPGERQLERVLLDLLTDLGDLGRQFSSQRLVAVERGQLEQLARLIESLLETAPDLERALSAGQPPHHAAGAFRIVPKVGRGRGAFELSRLLLELRQVKDAPACRSDERPGLRVRSADHPSLRPPWL